VLKDRGFKFVCVCVCACVRERERERESAVTWKKISFHITLSVECDPGHVAVSIKKCSKKCCQ